MPKYPKSRVKLALDTAKAVREISDILEDQAEISEVLINLACQEAYEQVPEELIKHIHGRSVGQMEGVSSKTDAYFGFNTNEVRELGDEEE